MAPIESLGPPKSLLFSTPLTPAATLPADSTLQLSTALPEAAAAESPAPLVTAASQALAQARHFFDPVASALAGRASLNLGAGVLAKVNERLKAAQGSAPPVDDLKGRLQALPQEQLAQDQKLLDQISKSPNARAALGTYLDLDAARKLDGGQRITPEIRDVLVRGVSDRRSGSERGTKGVLGQDQALKAAKAFSALSDDEADSVTALLNRAGNDDKGQPILGADPGLERALILKAVGARALPAQNGAMLGDDLQRLEGFAKDIRGKSRDELVKTTTLVDVHDENTSKLDPMRIGSTGDKVGDNDANYQRYTTSCLAAVSQMVHADDDPIYARQAHREGRAMLDREQKAGLEAPKFVDAQGTEVRLNPLVELAYQQGGPLPEGIKAVRSQSFDRALGQTIQREVKAKMDQLKAEGKVSPEAEKDFAAYLNGGDLTGPALTRAKEVVGMVSAQDPSGQLGGQMAEFRGRVQADAAGQLNGLTFPSAQPILGKPVEGQPLNLGDPSTTAAFEAAVVGAGSLPVSLQPQDTAGHPLSGDGHAILVSDLRTRAGSSEYLVTEPKSGKTSWVTSSALADGSAMREIFGLGAPKGDRLVPVAYGVDAPVGEGSNLLIRASFGILAPQ